jgi:hypothetical protein
VLLVLAGCGLRLWGAGSLLIFGDETHGVTWALGVRTETLAPYRPFGLWNTLALHTVGLGEWMLRAPALATGCGLTIVVALLAVRWLPAFEAVAITGFVALSPYLIYLSREGRTYSPALLATLLCATGVVAWLAVPRPARLIGAGACGAVAIFCHTSVTPAIALFAATAVVETLRRRELAQRWRTLLAAGLAGLLGLVATIGPNAMTAFDNVRTRSSASSATLEGALGALRLGFGLPNDAATASSSDFWVWGLLAVAAMGALRLARRHPLPTALAAAGCALQGAAVLWVQPTMLSVSWVLLRYLVPALPFVALCVVFGAAGPLAVVRNEALRERIGLALAAAACAVLALHTAEQHRYGALRGATHSMHPILLQSPRAEVEEAAAELLPNFYRDVLPGLPAGALIEAPLIMTYPLYALYQREHGRDYYGAALGPGIFQHAGRVHDGLEFRRAFDARLLPDSAPKDAAYLVVHRRPWDEILVASARFRISASSGHHIDAGSIGLVFRGRPLALDSLHPLAPHEIHRDERVIVYDLRANR